MLVLKNYKTFLQYVGKVLIPHINSQAVNIKRIGVVWDRHFQDNLKLETRNNCGAGVRINIFSNGKIINNWTIILCRSNTRVNYFHFYLLSTQLLSGAPNNKIIVPADCNLTRIITSQVLFKYFANFLVTAILRNTLGLLPHIFLVVFLLTLDMFFLSR